jgi:hypothetical protein
MAPAEIDTENARLGTNFVRSASAVTTNNGADGILVEREGIHGFLYQKVLAL